MARRSRLIVSALLAALVAGPAGAEAQSVGNFFLGTSAPKVKRGDWQGAYAKQAAQRDGTVNGGAADAATPAPRRQAQAQTTPAAPGAVPRATPPGRVRIQGRDANAPPATIPPPAGLSVDTRERMRRFVQMISTFARQQRRDFMIITEGALELLIKRDPVDETRISPARAYMHAIDGVLVDGLNYDKKVFGEPTSDAKRAQKVRLAEIARDNGVKVMVIDYTTDPKAIDESHRQNRRHRYVSYAAPAPLDELNRLATYPPRPFDENPHSIISLRDVRNFVYIGDSAAFGRMDEYALRMHATNFDLVVTNVFHGRDPLSKRAVETLKYKKVGAKRLVFATIDIGSAASYRYYWKPAWHEGNPAFIKAPYRDDPDRYHVEFWQPEWQHLVAGDNQSYVFGVIAQGFDGVVLRGMEDAYRFFEGGDEQQQEEQQQRQRLRPQPQAATPAPPATPAVPAPTVPGPTAPVQPTAPPPIPPTANPPTATPPAAPGAPTPLTPGAPATRP